MGFRLRSRSACLCLAFLACLALDFSKKRKKRLGRVVRRPVSANPGLNFNPGFFFFSSKAFSRKIFSILFRVFNHQIVEKRIKLHLHFKLSYLNSNFVLTLGYVNPALNNPALLIKIDHIKITFPSRTCRCRQGKRNVFAVY